MVLTLQPFYKETLWGGKMLREKYGRDIPFEQTGESWEVSSHPNGQSLIVNGPYSGMTLDMASLLYGEGLYGPKVKVGSLPLLFKLIDASDNLSIQVHPRLSTGDIQAKHEMSIILEAKPGAVIYAGFKEGYTKEDVLNRTDISIDEMMEQIPAHTGDAFFIPGGMIHALGRGILLAEIQTNSDITFRVYDWGRTANRAGLRTLHKEQAMTACDFSLVGKSEMPLVLEGADVIRSLWPACKFFAAMRVSTHTKAVENTRGDSFHILFCLEGDGSVDGTPVTAGQTLFLTADTGEYTVEGDLSYILFWTPDFERDYSAPLLQNGYSEEDIRRMWKDLK